MILFETDPMNTCCKENDCFDEYDRVAKAAADQIAKGQCSETALIQAISDWFFDGQRFDVGKVERSIKLLAGGNQ